MKSKKGNDIHSHAINFFVSLDLCADENTVTWDGIPIKIINKTTELQLVRNSQFFN